MKLLLATLLLLTTSSALPHDTSSSPPPLSDQPSSQQPTADGRPPCLQTYESQFQNSCQNQAHVCVVDPWKKDGRKVCVARGPLRCGGFAGFSCPTEHRCTDDPSDDCDPKRGGADCMGVCVPAPAKNSL